MDFFHPSTCSIIAWYATPCHLPYFAIHISRDTGAAAIKGLYWPFTGSQDIWETAKAARNPVRSSCHQHTPTDQQWQSHTPICTTKRLFFTGKVLESILSSVSSRCFFKCRVPVNTRLPLWFTSAIKLSCWYSVFLDPRVQLIWWQWPCLKDHVASVCTQLLSRFFLQTRRMRWGLTLEFISQQANQSGSSGEVLGVSSNGKQGSHPAC